MSIVVCDALPHGISLPLEDSDWAQSDSSRSHLLLDCIIPKFVVAEEEDLSHAQKQRVWSRSFGLQELYRIVTIYCTDCAPM